MRVIAILLLAGSYTSICPAASKAQAICQTDAQVDALLARTATTVPKNTPWLAHYIAALLADLALITGHSPAVAYTQIPAVKMARALPPSVRVPGFLTPGNEWGTILINENWLASMHASRDPWGIAAVRSVLGHELVHLLQYGVSDRPTFTGEQGCELQAYFMAGYLARPNASDNEPALVRRLIGLHDFATGPFDSHGTEPQRTAAVLAGLKAQELSFEDAYRVAANVVAALESTSFGEVDTWPLGQPLELTNFLIRDLWHADPFGLVMRGKRGYRNTTSDTLFVEVVWLIEIFDSTDAVAVRLSARSAQAVVAPQASVLLRQCSRSYPADWLAGATVRTLVKATALSRTAVAIKASSPPPC
jgi:hypothetical protein